MRARAVIDVLALNDSDGLIADSPFFFQTAVIQIMWFGTLTLLVVDM